MRKISGFLGVIALTLILGAGCSAGTVTPPTDQATYENTDIGFSIEYPKDWDKKEGVYDTVVAFVSPQSVDDPFADNITVTVKATAADVNEYVASAVNSAPKSFTDFKLIEDKPTTLAGEPAEMITYTFTEGTLKPYTREIFVVKNNKVFDITFTASQEDTDQYWAAAEAMIASFKITQ